MIVFPKCGAYHTPPTLKSYICVICTHDRKDHSTSDTCKYHKDHYTRDICTHHHKDHFTSDNCTHHKHHYTSDICTDDHKDHTTKFQQRYLGNVTH